MKLMKQQQKQFEKTRNAELVEMQRLEAVQKRLDSDEVLINIYIYISKEEDYSTRYTNSKPSLVMRNSYVG